MSQISAIDRLRELPDIFTGPEATIRFGWSSKTTSQYLYLWKRRGLIDPLGGHSDVFANLLVQPKPDWERALVRAMPSAMIIGVDALRRAGVTTQIPARPEAAVDKTHRVFQTQQFDIVQKSPEWFKIVEPGIYREGGIRALKPEWALADMLTDYGWGGCGLDPDDIDWPNGEPNAKEWGRAAGAFKLDEVQPGIMTGGPAP